MDLRRYKLFKLIVPIAVVFLLACSMVILFTADISSFTLSGLAIVFGLGVVTGFYISARLYIACTKTDE